VTTEIDQAGPLTVSPDGRWRTPSLAGRARPAHGQAEWIGAAAQADQRRRRIVELLELRATAQQAADQAQASADAAQAGLDELARQLAACPDDAPLRRQLERAHERDAVAARSAVAADQAQTEADRLRAVADTAQARVLDHCARHRLPADAAGLRATRAGLAEAGRRLMVWRHQAQAVVANQEALAVSQGHRDALVSEHATQAARRDTLAAALAQAEAAVAAISSTIGADDQAILDQLDTWRAAERDAITHHEQVAERRHAIAELVGQAKATLASSQDDRHQATAQRDHAFARFRQLVDAGLPGQIDLNLPAAHSAGVEAVRDQVAATRAAVRPRAWPDRSDDAEEQEAFLARRERELTSAAHDTRTGLEAGGRTLRLLRDAADLPQVEVVVDASGAGLGPRQAELRLTQIHDELAAAYNQRVQATLDELLGSTFLEHLRSRLGEAYDLVTRINAALAAHPIVTTQTSLQIHLMPANEPDGHMIDAIRGPSLGHPEVAARVRDNLRQRVERAKSEAETAGAPDWRDRLGDHLDYRGWLSVHLRRKIGRDGRWAPLTTQAFAELSGGARAVMLMLPLVATLAALYEQMDAAPRPLWLDEAFDGLDANNRAEVMALFGDFDLDVLLAGPTRLVNVSTVPAAAIYQVVRAPAPAPGVDLTLELWAGGDLIQVDLPVTLPLGQADTPGQDRLL
jgi:hypothetical protein